MQIRLKLLLWNLTLAFGGLGFMYSQTLSEHAPAANQPQLRPYAVTLANQIEQLNPNDVYDAYKIFLILRSPDVPLEQRRSLVKRILTGTYPNKPDFRWGAAGSFSLGYGMFVTALAALSHMHIDDPSILPFLEEFLPKWERVARASPDEELPADLQVLRNRVAPELALVRAVIARLKAVQTVPEVKTPSDLKRRVDAILSEAGLTREELNKQYEEFMNEVRQSREAAFATRSTFPMHLVNEIGRTLFHYAKRGMDVSSLTAVEDSVASALRAYVQAGVNARDPQTLIDQLAAAQARNTAAAQLLVDEGVRAAPLIIQKLEAIRNQRGAAPDTRYEVGTLMEVLGSLIGQDALPYLEPFSKDEREWLRLSARRVMEWVQEGRVFSFYPDW